MRWLEALDFFPKLPDSRPRREIESEILEELRFHIEMRIGDNVAAGMSEADACADAERRFGNFKRAFRGCRKAQIGERIMLQRLNVLLLVALLGGLIYLGVQFHSSQSRQVSALGQVSERLSALAAAFEERELRVAPEEYADVTGTVLDEDLEPIREADVLITVKTWPSGKYKQDAYAAKTDPQGKFEFSKVFPVQGKSAIHIAIVAAGHAFESDYFDNSVPAKRYRPKVYFLKKSMPFELLLRGSEGAPLADARVALSERQSDGEPSHFVYFQGSEPIWRRTNTDGRLMFDGFAGGDRGKIWVEVYGEWREIVLPGRIPSSAGGLVVFKSE